MRRDKALREQTNTFYNMLIIELLRFYNKHREYKQLGARLNGWRIRLCMGAALFR